jgi:hypothetical protein
MTTLTPLPPLPQASGSAPGTVSPEAWNSLVAYVQTLAKRQDDLLPQSSDDIIFTTGSGGTRATLKRRQGFTDTIGPFWPRFQKKPSGGWECTVSAGVVYDHVTMLTDAVLIYDCPNQFDGDDLHHFDISSDQAVYVKYEVRDTGAVGKDTGPIVSIIIDDDDLVSLHYKPAVEQDYGEAGTYYIKLAKIHENTDGTLEITRYAAGSHISHFRELPAYLSTPGGDATVFTKFNITNGRYDLKPLKGISPVKIEAVGEVGSEIIEISIDGTSADADKNLDLFFANVRVNGGGSKSNITLYWRAGKFVGATDPEAGDPAAGVTKVDALCV